MPKSKTNFRPEGCSIRKDSEGEVLKVSKPGTGGAINRLMMAGPKLTGLMSFTVTVTLPSGISTTGAMIGNLGVSDVRYIAKLPL